MTQANTALLPGEHIVMGSTDGSLVLTNLRVRHEGKVDGSRVYKSIPLSKVAGCSVQTRSYPILLLLAVLALLSVFGVPTDQARLVAGCGGLLLIACFFITRNGRLEIHSDGTLVIAAPTKGLKHDVVLRFVEAVAYEVSTRR